jgi:glycolate oxidase FAD binding subunit
MERDATDELAPRVRSAAASRTPLETRGSGSKAFYGRAVHGEPLSLQQHGGIIDYDPQELVLTARSGTPLTEIEALLAASGQHLPFEPPHFGPGATLGGTLACALAGPARAAVGPVRDFVLGMRVLTGEGRVLQFGGRVMKNVAGYDVSRLMVGALGTLGVLLDASLKVLPRPQCELTLTFPMSAPEALVRMNDWALMPLPISATCWVEETLYARLQGSAAAVAEAQQQLDGAEFAAGTSFWTGIREHTHPFFASPGTLWRVHVAAESELLDAPGRTLIEWNGAQRWFTPADAAEDVQRHCARCGGFATRFRRARANDEVFAPLPEALMRVHRELKRTFDPHGILNPGRLYADL